MVAQAGKDLLIQIDMNGGGDFQTIAGLRASKLSFNAQSVDMTHMGSAGRWRELIEGAGIRSASISGSGVFVDDQTDMRIQQLFFDGIIPNLRFSIPDFGDVTGKFQITSLEYAGNYDGEANYDIAFASAGALVFQAYVTE